MVRIIPIRRNASGASSNHPAWPAKIQSSSSTGTSGAVASGNFSSDYAMSLLAKVTHASADQALTLIQSMLPPTGEMIR